uniref:BPTI/Kunitz inhibitor domain-containing protein n=1 Tax=Megaselia scalaris TaxID=36166 RepID=T1GUN3_MEGSC
MIKYITCILTLLILKITAFSNKCQQPLYPGSCGGWEIKYFYDKNTSSCKSYIYEGCEGNENSFGTLEGCKRHCEYRGFQNVSYTRPPKARPSKLYFWKNIKPNIMTTKKYKTGKKSIANTTMKSSRIYTQKIIKFPEINFESTTQVAEQTPNLTTISEE